jgi:hypothetical protein
MKRTLERAEEMKLFSTFLQQRKKIGEEMEIFFHFLLQVTDVT